jgi:hypothetical protein
VSASAPGGQSAPLAGAFVALDPAQGARTETVTDSVGTATFPNVDVSPGPFAFTVAAPGYVAVSNLNMNQTGSWQLTLQPLASDEALVDVTGIVRGKSDPDYVIDVTTTSATSLGFSGIGPEYAVRVAQDAPFVAIVAELSRGPAPSSPQGSSTVFHEWASFPLGPFTTTTVVGLLLPGASASPGSIAGQSLVPLTGSGTIGVPPGLKGATGGLRVTSVESNGNAFQGAATRIEPTADGLTLQYDSEYVSLPGSASLETTYWLGLGDTFSYAYQSSAPTADVSLIDAPALDSPLPLYGSLPVRNRAAGAEVLVNVSVDDATIVWRVFSQGSADEPFRLPKLPSAIDPRTVLGTGRVTARPIACMRDASTGRCTFLAVGAAAELVSP